MMILYTCLSLRMICDIKQFIYYIDNWYVVCAPNIIISRNSILSGVYICIIGCIDMWIGSSQRIRATSEEFIKYDRHAERAMVTGAWGPAPRRKFGNSRYSNTVVLLSWKLCSNSLQSFHRTELHMAINYHLPIKSGMLKAVAGNLNP